MVKTRKTSFKSITIPEGLHRELEKCVEGSDGYYVSISEVAREAIREYLALEENQKILNRGKKSNYI